MKKPAADTKTGGIDALNRALTSAGEVAALRPAPAEDLQRATKAGLPKALIGFYRRYEPAGQEYVELEDRLYNISRALREMRSGTCGGKLFAEGFVPFAGTRSDDLYCLDTNMTTGNGEHPITFFPKDAVQRAADSIDIWDARVEVASSLDDFLVRFANRSLRKAEATSIEDLPVGLPEPDTGRSGLQLLKAAVRVTGQEGRIRPATATDLKRAEKAGFPKELLRFYGKYEPDPRHSYIELEQRLYSIKRCLQENRECVPGVALFPHGYIVFAGTTRGDVYCVDMNAKVRVGRMRSACSATKGSTRPRISRRSSPAGLK